MDQYIDQKLLEPPSKGNTPAFLTKLWKIVEDEQYDDLISWNENGTTIKIHQPVNFSQEILPRFYKHNNFSSFVRQVNMYGFRKIVDAAGGAKHGDGDWEFYHMYFQREHPENIVMMKRKGQLKEDMKLSNSQFSNLLQDVEKLKNQHDIVDEKLNLVKTENERLWREVFDLRERHSSQQAMIVKLIQFFLQLVMNKSDRPRKRRALHFQDGKSKKMAIQCYDSPSSSLTEIFGTDPFITTNQSPASLAQDRLTEISPDANATTVEVVNERQTNVYNSHSLGEASNAPSTVKPEQKALPTSPFVFPEIYKHEPDVIDLSSCISTDENILNPISYSVKTATPDLTTLVKKLPIGTQPLSTPVVSMPAVLTRQTSFRDREEVSTNVDKISKSIEMLQDMLNKQEINLDLKNVNLNSLYGEVPNNVSMQDLIKLIHQQNDENPSNEVNETMFPSEEPSFGGKVVPYTVFSPSHLIDPEFGTLNVEDDGAHSDFLDNVLQDEDDDEDDIILHTIPTE